MTDIPSQAIRDLISKISQFSKGNNMSGAMCGEKRTKKESLVDSKIEIRVAKARIVITTFEMSFSSL